MPVRPSVCLSVTRVDQSKAVEVRITQPSPQSSPMTLSFLTLNFAVKFQWEDRERRAPNVTGVAKMRNFQPISRRISETMQDRAIVTIKLLITNRTRNARNGWRHLKHTTYLATNCKLCQLLWRNDAGHLSSSSVLCCTFAHQQRVLYS